MKLSKFNNKCTESAYHCMDNLFCINIYDDFDMDCVTDENGDIDCITGKFYKWDARTNEYTLFKFKSDFTTDGLIKHLSVTREGIAIGKKRIEIK